MWDTPAISARCRLNPEQHSKAAMVPSHFYGKGNFPDILWQRSLYGVGYLARIPRPSNLLDRQIHIADMFPCIRTLINLLEGPECQTHLCKITFWESSQANLNSIWSMLGHGPTNQAGGYDHRTWVFFKSTASTTHRKNGSLREKNRRKEGRKKIKKYEIYKKKQNK